MNGKQLVLQLQDKKLTLCPLNTWTFARYQLVHCTGLGKFDCSELCFVVSRLFIIMVTMVQELPLAGALHV